MKIIRLFMGIMLHFTYFIVHICTIIDYKLDYNLKKKQIMLKLIKYSNETKIKYDHLITFVFFDHFS